MKLSRLLFFILLLASSRSLHAQMVDLEDESKLYASSKQVNQFFRRFNGEEDEKGNRYYEGDKQYRSTKLRKKYLGILFDASNKGMTDAVKTDFAKNVLDKSLLLDFHGGNWFSEVHTTFTQNGKDQPITLFMALEKDHLGYKWVIQRVYADMFAPYFARDTMKVGKFLHPLSHELDFMNLRKAFINSDSVSQFAAKSFKPDHLSLFLYEIKKGTLKFKTVNEVKFHFFQIDGWYFELAQFNRPGYNTGWLISSLTKLNTLADMDALRKYLYYETK
ncbi:hypothetical protein SAMN04488109_3859 [Chryseolinea serpens]|uniref:Uncharacterized protein n=1 Tax=Chryseolinea serpens TaxID=947013 RepID=A0A1M5SC93_9BACT|nr:hypothetical protein [Chryseolinea serpens]SHH36136.1 hypothetical protein SAMN04488109_3859 [Chryseolinea serpens]